MTRDHGGGLDAAIAQYGGMRAEWIDLSTGINPTPYPVQNLPQNCWQSLPDRAAQKALIAAARDFWNVPKGAEILAVPGCSAAIAQIPALLPAGTVDIKEPTYNEHRAGFENHGWKVETKSPNARVIVHPNNPTGHFHTRPERAEITVIDESFCDIAPGQSLIQMATQKGVLILKSFGKFWGLAGLRLGFVIGDPDLISTLRERLGPWPVSGPALIIGTQALNDMAWADQTRTGLTHDIMKLDQIMAPTGARPMGNVPLFRTYETPDAQAIHTRLAKAHIWSRVFPYNPNWIRLGLPPQDGWDRLKGTI